MAESHQEKVLRIIAERNGLGKGPLSAEERLMILQQARDDSLCWVADCARTNKATGSGAAKDLHDFACENITKLENEAHAGATTRVPWSYTAWDGDTVEASKAVN